jgi:GGDEF domain-containing protein
VFGDQSTTIVLLDEQDAARSAEKLALVLINAPDESHVGKEFAIAASGAAIGRAPDNDIVLHGNSVSRRHCLVSRADSGIVVIDRGSSNGTWVGANRCGKQPVSLAQGQQLRVGDYSFALLEARRPPQAEDSAAETGTTSAERLAGCMQASLADGKGCTVILWQMQDLPKLLDVYGDGACDRLLCIVSRRLASSLEATDLNCVVNVARVGVASIAAVLPVPTSEHIERIATRAASSVSSTTIPLIGHEVAARVKWAACAARNEHNFDGILEELQGRLGPGMHSAFISHGGPDGDFARRLADALRDSGVATFLFERDAKPGQVLHDLMYGGVNGFDRVILVCSQSSLNRPGVLNEIEETLRRESREGGVGRLIPVSIDNAVLTCDLDARGVIQRLRDRVIVSFADALKNPAVFDACVGRLVAALRREGGEPSPEAGRDVTYIPRAAQLGR